VKTEDDGSGLAVQIARRGLVLADVEAWCAAMRAAGAAADSPAYGEERYSRMRVLTGYPGATAGQPDRPLARPLDLYAPPRASEAHLHAAVLAAAAGRHSWVALNGQLVALLLPPRAGEL
jgi:hypothetical protein